MTSTTKSYDGKSLLKERGCLENKPKKNKEKVKQIMEIKERKTDSVCKCDKLSNLVHKGIQLLQIMV